jgi:hypothetical protein
MNDSAISRAIAHTHFVIIAAIVFCLLVITLLYVTLSSGLHIGNLKFGSIQIKQLYMKWDNSLSVDVGTLRILGNRNSRTESKTPDIQKWHALLARVLRHADDTWVGSFHIAKLETADANGSFYLDPHSQSTFTLHSPRFSLDGTMTPLPGRKSFFLHLNAGLSDFNATLRSEGILRSADATLYLDTDINVSNRIFLAMGLHAGKKALSVNVYSTKWFDSAAPLVKPLRLGKDVQPWIIARAKGGPLMLHTLRTTMPYADPGKAFDNLYGYLTFRNIRYAFANDPNAFEPAKAREATVVFKDKRLHIVPVDTTFYGQNGGATWLDIDFSKSVPVLDLYLASRMAFSPPLQRLTQSYGVHLPFVQKSGTTDAELTLHIELEGMDTTAEGTFHIRNGLFNFSGLPVDINDSSFDLNNSDITIHALHASLFDGNVTASATGEFDPAKADGRLHILVPKATFGISSAGDTVTLGQKPFAFDYVFSPKGDHLRCAASEWHWDEHNVSVAPFDAPFDFGKLEMRLPRTQMDLDDNISAFVSGPVTLSSLKTDLSLDLVNFSIGTFKNAQKHTYFHIRSDGNLSIETNASSHWSADETAVTIGPVSLKQDKGELLLSPVGVAVTNQFTALLTGSLDMATLSAELNVTGFKFEDKTLEQLFESADRFSVYIVPLDDEFDIIVPSLNMIYSTVNEGWRLHFFSLEAFKERSPLLNEYNLTQSSFTAWSTQGGYPVDFKGIIDYPYALTVQQGKPVSIYRFNGRFDENGSVAFTVNDAASVSIGKAIHIHTNAVAFNLPELARFFADHKERKRDANTTSTTKAIMMDANNTSIVFTDGRRAKADRMALQYENDVIHAQLFKGRGGAMLEVKNNRFYLYGKDLDDDFMEHFFKLSKFRGGTLDFYAVGSSDNFKGLVKITDTTIYDYVLLNNLFAFMNTVPALVTFSLPSYESKGIKIQNAYAELRYHDSKLNISGINIQSKEMGFTGQGLINYDTDRMNMQMTVKTTAVDNIRKIPLVGYIIAGDKAAFTTVNITGPIENPKISSTIAKDIIVAPFNILKRTFNFPIHYLEQFEKASQTPKGTSPAD